MNNTKGVRISDEINRVVGVNLIDILDEIPNGISFYWTMLFLNINGLVGDLIEIESIRDLDHEDSVNAIQKAVLESENGIFMKWEDIILLPKKIFQIIDITLIASKNMNALHRYENDQEMYEACDISIEMVDGCYWEVFSNDTILIDRLASKFKDVKFLETDFIK